MRHAILRVTPQAFIEFCKWGPARRCVIVDYGLPDDATFVRAGHDATGTLCLVVSSDDFADVDAGAPLPELPTPIFRLERADG